MVARYLVSHVMIQELDDDQLRHNGYIVFADNFYSSPALFKSLVEKGFGASRTVRHNRKSFQQRSRAQH